MERYRRLVLGRHEELGHHGLGPHRTLEEFEAYAEVEFRRHASRPRIPVEFRRVIRLNTWGIPARDDYLYWMFCLLDEDEKEVYRCDIEDRRILAKRTNCVEIHTRLSDRPVHYLLWPFSKRDGYGPRLVFPLDP